MEITLQAVLLIVINVFAIGGIYARITNQLTRLSTVQESFEKRISDLEDNKP